jgi:PAS domain S-box-containing protein
MKKSALQYTLILVSIPTLLVLIGHNILNHLKSNPNYDFFNLLKDFIILFISAVVAYNVILNNNARNKRIFEKIKKNNEEMRLSNERYNIVAKATSDTIWDWKLDDDTFIWNKGIQGIFGYKKEELGKTCKWWFDKIHPEDSLKISVKMYTYVENRTQRWEEQYRFQCADGTYKYVLDRGFLVSDTNGTPIRLIGAIQDITKQKIEEQRLKLLETVITQSKDSVIITKTNEVEATIPTVVYVNPAFTKITGYKAKDVIGKPASTFFNRKALKNDISKLSNALKNKEEFQFESLNAKKTGEEYWINFSMTPITNIDGEHSHWISIQREITEQKEREKEREQLIRELTQNNKDLKQFSYITSHNLRAPLSNLTGLLNLINDIKIDNPELKEIINGFSSSTNLLNDTINDLVKVIIIKDSPSISKEKILISEVINNVLSQLNNLLNLHKPEINLDLEKTPYLVTNKSYFESIVLNLLTNAIKYRPKDKTLKIEITSKEVNNKVILSFKDNGIGIDLERNKDKVFGLYQRFHNYPDSKGLGLYLVKSQVESMGGIIEIESEVNIGTKFTITFKNEKND